MNARIDENELLGFIEGDLPAARMLEVERALRSDGGLSATLDAMRRDRMLLRAEFAHLFAQAGGKAPHRTVQEAIEAAEREAILVGVGTTRRPGVLARIGAHRGLAAAASMALLVSAGAIVWNASHPTTLHQIGGERAATISGAQDDVNAIDSGALALNTIPATKPQADVASTTHAEITPERIDQAIQLAQNAENSQRALRPGGISPAAFTPTPVRSWTDLHRQAPVLPTSVPSRLTTNDLPLAAIIEALDKSRVDWSKWDNEVLTLAVAGRDRAFTKPQTRDLPDATPASYEDALRLAGLNRLSLRVQADDPLSVERELFRLAAQHGMSVELQNRGDACGSLAYSVEMPRTKGDMEALVDAISGCAQHPASARRTFFDVSLLPIQAAPGVGQSSLSTPVQITGGSPRVSVPVLIERSVGR